MVTRGLPEAPGLHPIFSVIPRGIEFFSVAICENSKIGFNFYNMVISSSRKQSIILVMGLDYAYGERPILSKEN